MRYFFVAVFSLLNLSAFCQNSAPVFMKWKLKPGEVLSYKTTMEETDTANRKDISMNGFMKSMGNDSAQIEAKKFFEDFRKQAPHPNYVTHLTENKKKIIDIEMLASDTTTPKPITDTGAAAVSERAMQMMMHKAANGTALRGAIYEDGTLESFYTQSSQKNLIAIMFVLPGHPVKTGDSWPLHVNFLAMNEGFKCDSSFKKDMVTVVKIENRNNEQVVTLKYDILEYISGTLNSPMDNSDQKLSMKIGFNGVASFSIEKGRWIAFDGVLFTDNSGAMESRNAQRLSLVEEKSN